MPSFAYSAINAEGAELTGEIQATDLSAARDVAAWQRAARPVGRGAEGTDREG